MPRRASGTVQGPGCLEGDWDRLEVPGGASGASGVSVGASGALSRCVRGTVLDRTFRFAGIWKTFGHGLWSKLDIFRAEIIQKVGLGTCSVVFELILDRFEHFSLEI